MLRKCSGSLWLSVVSQQHAGSPALCCASHTGHQGSADNLPGAKERTMLDWCCDPKAAGWGADDERPFAESRAQSGKDGSSGVTPPMARCQVGTPVRSVGCVALLQTNL